jgi:2-polyprenyl-3-methyl-5-hydroxy-6-metoxy-1,4-benzoquinol methylase
VEQFEITNINNCPICEGSKQIPFLTCKDYTVSKESFNLVSCGDCSFRYTQNPPTEKEAYRFYQSEDYVSHSSTKKGLINRLYNFVRSITLKQKVKIIKRYSKGKNLIDIGAGTGHFLNTAQKEGYNTVGFEPGKDAAQFAKDHFGIELLPTEKLFSCEEKSADIITMWHVLEHVYPLKNYIENIHRMLKDDGTLIIAVPNCASYDAEHYKENWAAYDVPRHLYHFRPSDVEKLFQSLDFVVVNKLPMKFDAYYVAMLSEKNKSGNLLNAIWLGFISNRKARRSGMYSSLIYVLQKRK